MAAPIYYRWDDPNAPVACGTRTSLISILKACLVDGYGTKPAAGWTMPYDNGLGTKAAFRNNPLTGTGFFLQVDAIASTYAWLTNLKGYEAMTSVDDGLFPFTTGYDIAATSGAESTALRPWVLIADDRAFWFICWWNLTSGSPTTNLVYNMIGFGDIISRYANDPFGCFLTGYHAIQNYGPMVNSFTGPDSTTGYIAIPRKISGVASQFLAAHVRGGGPGGPSYPGCNGLAYSSGDPILVTRPYLSEGTAFSFRGWLPGYFYPCHQNAFDQFATVAVGEKSFLSIRGYVTGYDLGNFFISLDDWRV